MKVLIEHKPLRITAMVREKAKVRVIEKRCNSCGTYFTGELDGEYGCPSCRADERLPIARLSSLESLFESESNLAA